MKRIRKIITFVICIALMTSTSFAHSGRTDSNGGHKDKNNVSGLGSYHYHHGYSAHLHPDGICPYDSPAEVKTSTSKTPTSSTSSKTSTSIQSSSNQSQTSKRTEATTVSTTYKMELPKFDIHINGIEYDNNYEKYPIYYANNTAFLPLTWEIENLLGIDGTKIDGASYTLENKKGQYSISTLSAHENQYSHKSRDVNCTNYDLRINSSDYENCDFDYSVLVIDDVVYIPLNWDIAVDKLNLSVSMSKDSGLEIANN